MNEIFGKTATSEAGSSHLCRAFAMLIGGQALPSAILPRKPSKRFAVQCLATPETVSNKLPSRRAQFPCPWLCSFDRGGLRSLEGLARCIASLAKRVPGSDRT